MLSGVGLSLIHFGDRPERTVFKQTSISEMERRSECIRTSSKNIEAMGGELQIIANMSNGRIVLPSIIASHAISFPGGTARAGC
jgi:hypothetical protein